MRIKNTNDDGRLIQKSGDTLFVQRLRSPAFGIFRFIRGHDPSTLEDKLQLQCVLLEVTQPQSRRDRTQLPRDRSHHLAKKLIEYRDRRKRAEASAKSLVRVRHLADRL